MFGCVLPLLPKLDFERAPKVRRLPRVPLPPGRHDWENLDSEQSAFRCVRCFMISFDGESRPMTGCVGVSMFIRRLRGAETESHH
eukprot:8594787-Pyramimonas_sp.AAC.1